MRILCSSDIHGEMNAFRRFERELRKPKYAFGVLAGDLMDDYPTKQEAMDFGIVSAGDFVSETRIGWTMEDLDHQMELVQQMFHDEGSVLIRTLEKKRDAICDLLNDAGKPVFFVLGNHDRVDWPDAGHMVNVHGRTVEDAGLKITGYRWAPIDRPDARIERDMASLRDLVDKDTILITHSPPHGILDRTKRGEHIGSPAIRTLVDEKKPRLNLFGHVHEAFGRSGSFVNASYFSNDRFVSVKL